MTFNLCNLGSKYPYFNMAYVVSNGFGCPYLHLLSSFNPTFDRLITLYKLAERDLLLVQFPQLKFPHGNLVGWAFATR